MIAFLQGAMGVATFVVALFGAFGVGVAIEKHGSHTAIARRQVLFWFYVTVTFTILSIILLLSAGRG